jgi:hypothetical protein
MEELHVKRFPGEALEDWPNRIDLQLAMQSLNYIQDVYSYNYQQVINMNTLNEIASIMHACN